MARPNPIQFLQQVRQETNKVVWPGRNEVLVSTIMVIVLVIIASLFFLLSDQLISWAVGLMLSIR
jgi:preprotein translocase subunit SecE